MGKQMCCFVLSILVVAACFHSVSSTTTASSTKKRDWYDILYQLTLRNKRLQRDVAKCETRLETCTGVVEDYNKLSATRVNASILTGHGILKAVKQYLHDATLELKKYKVLNSKCPSIVKRPRVKQSCAAWKAAGWTKSGIFKIDLDGSNGLPLFEVECVMDDGSGKVVTVFHHDSEVRTTAGKCQNQLECVKKVTYKASMAQITSIVKVSSSCKQFIKYDCSGSLFQLSGNQFQGWYSRDGALMDYWGGATPGSKKCGCGATYSCVSGLSCNCDKNDFVWRSDSGYLSDKTTLPVSKMAFGDLDGNREDGYYTLGPLKCYN